MQRQNPKAFSEEYSRFRWEFPFLLLLLFAAASAFCLFLYKYDNKYTAPGPDAVCGRMELDSPLLDAQGLVWLVDGWEFYGDRLFTPKSFRSSSPVPDRYLFAGQSGGFEAVTGQPFGSASYRLTVQLPDERRTYALYLPEIFSSCRLYINGTMRLALGETAPESYRAETAEKVVSFEASGQAELLLAVSNFSAAYSGLTYPPALGTPDAVYHMVSFRLYLRTALLSVTLLLALIALLIGLADRKNPLPFLYALFCLFFVGFTCYPVVKTLFHVSSGFYLLENLSFCAMILMVFLLQRKLFSPDCLTNTFGIAMGGFVCLSSVIYHIFLPQASLWIMLSYSRLIAVYKWLGAALLTVNMVQALRRTAGPLPYARVLLCGMVIFDSTLVMDRLLPLYEPVYSGWFLEVSSLCLVLLIGIVTLLEIYRHTAANLVLNESIRLTRQNLALQKEQSRAMQDALNDERRFRHDLRHHISVLHEFAAADDMESLKHYFTKLEKEVPGQLPKTFCENAAVNAILRHYAESAEASGTEFSAAAQINENLPVNDVDLCVLFGNCLENALEACCRQKSGRKYIQIHAGVSAGLLVIVIENSFDGSIRRSTDGFLSSKRPKAGIGTASVQTIAKKYGGRASFETDGNIFRVSILLHL